MSRQNKVKFNLSNVHYALQNVGQNGAVTFGTPVPIRGAVSLSLSANGEMNNFHADGIAYYTVSGNMGYEGDLEVAMIPDSFRQDVLHETLDRNGVLIENANAQTTPFALLFEFDGNEKKIRYVLYNCTVSRPTIASKTNEESIEVQTETLSIKASPLADGRVKGQSGDNTSELAYRNWYDAVYIPSQADDSSLLDLSIGSLIFSPAFSPNTLAYTVTTSSPTNTITATASDSSATVAITVNEVAHTNGTTATWQTGTNTVVVTVTTTDSQSVYTVTVTKEA